MALFCLISVGILLGLTATVAKIAIGAGWHPIAFLIWSVLGGGLALLAGAVLSGNRPGLGRGALAYYLICGLLSIAAPNAIGFMAVPQVGASFVALSLAFPLLLTYAMAVGLGMERFRGVRAAGVLSGLAGGLVIGTTKAGSGTADPAWVAAALSAPIFIAAGNIYRTLRWPAGATAISLAPGMLLGGVLFLLPLAAALRIPMLPEAPGPLAYPMLALQIGVFAATYALYFVLQKLAGPVYLSQIGSVGAIFGAALGVTAFGELAGPPLFAAAALILLGVALVNRRPRDA